MNGTLSQSSMSGQTIRTAPPYGGAGPWHEHKGFFLEQDDIDPVIVDNFLIGEDGKLYRYKDISILDLNFLEKVNEEDLMNKLSGNHTIKITMVTGEKIDIKLSWYKDTFPDVPIRNIVNGVAKLCSFR